MSAEQLSLAQLRVFQDVGRTVHLAGRDTGRLQSLGDLFGVRSRVHADTRATSSARCASRASPVANRASSASSASPKTALAERQSASVRIEIDTPLVVTRTRKNLVEAGVVNQFGVVVGPYRVGDVVGVELVDDGLGLRDVHAGAVPVRSRWISAASAPIAVIRPTT